MKTNLQTAMSFDLKVAPVSLPAREIAVRFSATVIQSRRDRQHFLDSGSGNGNRSRGISQHETNFGPAKGSAVRDVRSIHEMSSIVLKFGVACFPRFVQLFRKSHATEVSMKNLFSRIGSSVLMVFVLFFSPNVLRADVTGSILGTVHDSTGAVVAGAVVVVTNAQTNFHQESVSAADGSYHLLALPAGIYKVTVTAKGFKTYNTTDVEVKVNDQLHVDVTLREGLFCLLHIRHETLRMGFQLIDRGGRGDVQRTQIFASPSEIGGLFRH